MDSILGALIERLAPLGLTANEAATYAALATRGPMTVAQAAAASGTNRTDAYRTLKRLETRGFVRETLSKPSRYTAEPVDRVFDDVVAGMEAQRIAAEHSRDAAIRLVKEARSETLDDTQEPNYKMVFGRATIYGALEGMIRRAKENASLASSYARPELEAQSPRPWMTTLRRVADGSLALRILLPRVPDIEKTARRLVGARSEVRVFDPTADVRFAVVDDKEALFWFNNDPSLRKDAKKDVAIWTDTPSMVGFLRLYFDMLWAQARSPETPPHDHAVPWRSENA